MRTSSAGLALFLVLAGSASAQQSKVFANDGSSGDEFGGAVDIDGDTCVVGTRLDDEGGYSDLGSVYVYRKVGGNWVHEAKLVPSDPANSRYFGCSVSIDGNVIAVGAYNSGPTNGGAVYVFRRTGSFPFVTWTQEAELLANDTFYGNGFGYSVSLDGNQLAAGCPYWNSSYGAVYVFTRTASVWNQTTRLIANDGYYSDELGHVVSLQDGTVVAGAPYDDTLYTDQGSAYVFVDAAGQWSQQQKLGGWLTNSSTYFGWSIALESGVCMIGAPRDIDSSGNPNGATYLYRRTGTAWNSTARLTASDGTSNDRFGDSVALSSTFALVGTPYWEGSSFSDPGSIYVFAPSGGFWIQTGQITATDLSNSAYYGSAVALDESTAIVGARSGTGALGSTGAAYVLTSVVSAPVTYCTSKVNSLGCTPATFFSGAPSYTSPESFEIGAQQILNNKYGFLIYSKSNSASTPFQGGTLCVQPPVQRTPTQDSGGAAPPANNCSGTYSYDFNDRIQSGVDPQLLPGQVVWTQHWYRDPQSPSTTGLSDGLQFVIGP